MAEQLSHGVLIGALQSQIARLCIPLQRTSALQITADTHGASSSSALDSGDQVFQTTTFGSAGPDGPDFPVVAGEGYLVEMTAAGKFPLSGFAVPVSPDLVAGLTVVGFHPTTRGFGASELLTRLGDAGSVASVSRHDSATGRYQTAVWRNGSFSGPDFELEAGEGYIMSSPAAVADLRLPRRLTVFGGELQLP